MKKVVSIIALAVMAGVPSFAELPLFLDQAFQKQAAETEFTGLFGVKFGERMPSNVAVTPSPDGTLLTRLEPKNPEFVFQEYYAVLLPQTYVVVGFAGADTFEGGELAKCNEAYDRCRKAVEKRLGKKMTVVPPTESGTGDAQTPLHNCIVEVSKGRLVMLQTVKQASGGYIMRLIALDVKASQAAVEQSKTAAKSIPPLEGLFGRRIGENVPVSDDEASLANGWKAQSFEPEKKFLDFDTYVVVILPKSRRTAMIISTKDFDERFEATECFARVCRLLERKFKQKMADTSSNFDGTKPDEDGEQIFKATAMTFPNSLRLVEVDCLRDEDDKVFRVRIKAYDQSLLEALAPETKLLKREKDDEAALDAL